MALVDSQYFGVAQRRKRVFIVLDFGGESVDEILAITESLPGHPPPSREAGKGTAGDATKGVGADVYSGLITGETACTLTSRTGAGDASGPKLIEGPCYENHSGDSRVTDAGETCPTITKRCGTGGGNLPYIRQQARILWLLAKASNTRLATLSVGNSCLTFLLNRLWLK